MSVVQTFEKTLDTDERLAALAAAMNRLPAEAVVRRLSAADPAPPRVTSADRPAPGAAQSPTTSARSASRPSPSPWAVSDTSPPPTTRTPPPPNAAPASTDAPPGATAPPPTAPAAPGPSATRTPAPSDAAPTSTTSACATPGTNPSPATRTPSPTDTAAPASTASATAAFSATPSAAPGRTTAPSHAPHGTPTFTSTSAATFIPAPAPTLLSPAIRPERESAPLLAEPSPATPPSPDPGHNPTSARSAYPPLSAATAAVAAPAPVAIPDPSATPGFSTMADPGAVPVPEPLAGLLPGGLRRGEAAALATRNQGPDYLALALLAEALKAGLWCAVIGVPELGLAALTGLLGPAAQRQAALDRLLLVAEPGDQWAEITATLADGVDLLLARPATPVRAETAQRVDARLRQGRSAGTRHSAALLVLGGWPTARLALRIARTDWTGLDGIGPTAGTGHLTAGRAIVVAQGRATAGRPRVARLWLPDATGTVRSLSDDPQIVPGRPSQSGLNAPTTTVEPAIAAPSLTLIPAAMSPAFTISASTSGSGTATASPAPTPASPAA